MWCHCFMSCIGYQLVSGCWLLLIKTFLVQYYLKSCLSLIVSAQQVRSGRVGKLWVPLIKQCHLVGPRKHVFFLIVPVLWTTLSPPQRSDDPFWLWGSESHWKTWPVLPGLGAEWWQSLCGTCYYYAFVCFGCLWSVPFFHFLIILTFLNLSHLDSFRVI